MQLALVLLLVLAGVTVGSREAASNHRSVLASARRDAVAALVNTPGRGKLVPPRDILPQSATPKVQYGQKALSGQLPYLAALFYGSFNFCSGTLIHPSLVLTAGHCVRDVSRRRWFALDHIKIGITDTKQDISNGTALGTAQGTAQGTQRGWKRRVLHRKFDGGQFDIALIVLDQPVTSVPTVQLARSGEEVSPWRALTVAGFGRQDRNLYNTDLRAGTVQYVPDSDCRRLASYLGPFPLGRTLMCAGYVITGTDVCSGDSRGPLLVWDREVSNHVQVGITHAGLTCDTYASPIGSYTKVAALRRWIDSNINMFTD